MRCAVLKKADEKRETDIDVEILREREGDSQKARIVSRKGKSLDRLSRASWTRKDSYGYLRNRQGKLWKIDGLEFDESLKGVMVLYLIPVKGAKT